jgi:hypothetical protein
LYYYLQEPESVKAKAKRDEEAMKKNAQELRDSTKKRGEDALKQGEAKYDAIKVRLCTCAMIDPFTSTPFLGLSRRQTRIRACTRRQRQRQRRKSL